jgi:type IV secretion system protein VirB4
MVTPLRESAEQVQEASRSLTDLIPWLMPLNDQIVLCKDGSLMAVFEYAPPDPDGQSPESSDGNAAAAERALMPMRREDVMLWFIARRQKDHSYPSGKFDNVTAQEVDDYYRKGYKTRIHYGHKYYMAVLLSPEKRSGKMIDTFLYNMEQQRGVVQSAGRAVKSSIGFSAMEIAEANRLEEQRLELETLISYFIASLPVKMRRVSGNALWGLLNSFASASVDEHPVSLPASGVLLDGYLGEDTIAVENDHLVFEGHTSCKYVAALSIKNEPEAFPNETKPGMMDKIYGVDSEWTYCMALKMTSLQQARGVVQKFARFYRNTRKGIMTMLGETITQVESSKINYDADVHEKDANAALADFSENPVAAYANITLLIQADSLKELERGVEQMTESIHENQFMTIRERMHLLSSWAGTLPGQWAIPVRWVFLTGGPIADMLPLHGIYQGAPFNAYLTKQRGSHHSALAVMDTAQRTTFHFNFHVGDLGHTLLVGPSRSGKSVWVNFLLSQFHRYPNSRIIVFDKDRSCWITTHMHGGKYMGVKEPGGISMNPVKTLDSDSDADWNWFKQFADQILSVRDGPLTADEITELSAAVDRCRKIPASLRTLLTLNDCFTGESAGKLKGRLAPWIGNGVWAHFFNGKDDSIEFARFTTLSVDEILDFKDAARAFLLYLFHRIEKSLDGAPTIIYLEEAWFALEDPIFSQKLKEWLKRLAKMNVIVVMATQSALDAADSKAFASILDNVPTMVFLPNERANAFRKLYKDAFQLEDHQIELLSKMTPKSDYFVVQRGVPKLINCKFSTEVLTRLRSDDAAKKLFQQWMDSGNPDWKAHYVEAAKTLD